MAKNKGGSRKKSGRGLIIALSVVLVAVLALFGGVYFVFKDLYSQLDYNTGLNEEELQQAIDSYKPEDYLEPEDIENLADTEGLESDAPVTSDEEADAIEQEMQAQAENGKVVEDDKVYNILLIGTDSRSSKPTSRSDAMMLVSVNKSTKQITVTSFMRDIYTYIPDLGYSNRLNVPCAVGGPAMLISTIEQVFGVKIDNYAMVNFMSFIAVIDAVGGVDIEITEDEIWYFNSNLEEQNDIQGYSRRTDKLSTSEAGLVHMNGNQALAYARIRKLGGDQGRTERQRTVIAAIAEKAKTMSIEELYDLVKVLLPLVTTDLSESDCLSLVVSGLEYLSYDIQMLRIPEDGTYYGTTIRGMSVLKIDFDAARQLLQEKIYGVEPQ